MKNRWCTFLFAGVFLILCTSVYASDFSVTFINPGVSDKSHATGGFWTNVSNFMQAAADDLEIDLEVIYAERNYLNLKNLVQEVADRSNPPDYLIIVNEKYQGTIQLEIAMSAGIKTFMMLNTLVRERSILEFGTPRMKYSDWIGSLIPDNYYAGYQNAKSTIEIALHNGAVAGDGKLHIIGMAGDHVTPASTDRNEGLVAAVAEYPDVLLDQIFVCEWSKEIARDKAQKLFNRYPEVGMIWSANDPIALGAIEGTIEEGKIPGRDIFFGGLNWDIPALQAIQEGTLSLSMGGHFMTGGWVLVLLHDYENGKDFADEGIDLQMKIFDEINASNVDEYVRVFGSSDWTKIDFKHFSKVLNLNLNEYKFSLKAIFQSMK